MKKQTYNKQKYEYEEGTVMTVWRNETGGERGKHICERSNCDWQRLKRGLGQFVYSRNQLIKKRRAWENQAVTKAVEWLMRSVGNLLDCFYRFWFCKQALEQTKGESFKFFHDYRTF